MNVDEKKQNTVETLLKDISFKVGTLREAKRRFSSQLAPDFSVFNYLRTDEMALSRIIADLLDPKGTHGQGSIFLKQFIEMLDDKHGWVDSTADWRIETERQANGLRRIDIFLESSLGVVGIENKPWAADQDNQLSDYADFLKVQAEHKERNWLLIYIGNNDPQEHSISKDDREHHTEAGNFLRVDFNEIVNWLRMCMVLSESFAVRVFIEDIAKFVRININGELDMTEEKEVDGVIFKSKTNIEAAFHVANTLNTSKQRLLEEFRRKLKKELEARSYFLEWDSKMDHWSSCCGFGVSFQESQKLYLRFEFERTGLNRLFWGIRRRDANIHKSEDTWQAIHQVMAHGFGESKGLCDWWPWYSMTPDADFIKEYQNWGSSATPWIEMNDGGKLANKIVTLAEQVHSLFKNPEGMELFNPS